MKHLKRYNESIYVYPVDQDMINDLKDMLLDISDLGFHTSVTEDKYIITVCISRLRHRDGFIRSEEESKTLKEVMNRIKDYGRSRKYLVDLTWIGRIT